MCVSGETPNCNDKVCKDKVVGVRMEEELGGMEEEKKIKAQDVPSLDCLPPPSTMKLLWSSRVMTANTGFDLQPTRELVAGRKLQPSCRSGTLILETGLALLTRVSQMITQ
jgi:hypothetical protein